MWSLEDAAAYYKTQGAPKDQNALIGLLREIQRENDGSIPPDMLKEAADLYGIKEGVLLTLVRRIPSLRLGSGHCLELCAGPNCGKHTKLADYAEGLKRRGGDFELKYVPCMRMCGKGPNIRWDGTVYHQATEELLRKLTGDGM